MVGRVRKTGGYSSSSKLVIIDDKHVLKANGNQDKNKIQKNDWVMGPIGDDVLSGWSKFKGGNSEAKADYDISDSINPQNFPDL
ncbi:hypothetical protein [Maribacter sp.]|uniref:hypothetical protein n=1 Tax=Maribacter sp. TaxID=1897614 RepID=UPI0025BD5C3D|nr:hypothetical protein [Maribacter sp.]